MIPAIQIDNLTKYYPRPSRLRDFFFFQTPAPLEALQDVSLRIEQGQIYGLLGPNGSGKTTLQKIICGLLLPDAGQVEVMGQRVDTKNAAFGTASYVFDGERSFYWRLTGRQNLEFFAAMSGYQGSFVREQIPVLAHRLDMEEHLEKRVANFSTGNKQKLSLIRALLTNPGIIVMDEPTRSLDPAVSEQVYDLTRELVKKEGKTVIWATHNLAEAEDVCNHVAIISHGRILAESKPQGIRERYFQLAQTARQVAISE